MLPCQGGLTLPHLRCPVSCFTSDIHFRDVMRLVSPQTFGVLRHIPSQKLPLEVLLHIRHSSHLRHSPLRCSETCSTSDTPPPGTQRPAPPRNAPRWSILRCWSATSHQTVCELLTSKPQKNCLVEEFWVCGEREGGKVGGKEMR